MIWGFFGKRDPHDAGARFRAEHSMFLTRALSSDPLTRRRYGIGEYPRIPVRDVRSGGFGRLMSTLSGRRLAERWWRIAFQRVEPFD